jgi:hypothetical protein
VSIDFRGNPASSIVDAPLTKVVEGSLAKVFSWYDNEWGFSNRVQDLIHFMAKRDHAYDKFTTKTQRTGTEKSNDSVPPGKEVGTGRSSARTGQTGESRRGLAVAIRGPESDGSFWATPPPLPLFCF